MRYLLLFIPLLLSQKIWAQPNAQPHTVKKTKHIVFNKHCFFDKYWYNVVLPDKNVAAEVNKQIDNQFNGNFFTPDKDNCCNKDNEYSYTCEVAYLDKLFFSLYVDEHNFYKGSQHGYFTFGTLNFNLTSGKQISFSDMILPEKKPLFDSLALQRLGMVYGSSPAYFSQTTTDQLANMDFKIGKGCIILMFHRENFGDYIEQPWTFDELRTFMKPEFMGY